MAPLKDEAVATAGNFSPAKAESQMTFTVEELRLEQPVVGHQAPRSIGRDKETAHQG
jgi:hypothetical protein